MDIKTVLNCPLGHKCQELRDGSIHQCAWYVKLSGTNPNTGESIDEHGCSMSWIPVLLIENTQQQKGTSAAVESFRNEMVKSSEIGHQVLLAATQAQPGQGGAQLPAMRVIESN